MEYTNEVMQEYDVSKYNPVPVDGFDFPVGAALLDLAQLSMHVIQWHWHEEVEFVIVQRGLTKIQLPDENIILNPGDGIFLNQNLLHSIHSMGKEDSSVYTFKFNPAIIFGYAQTALSAKYLLPIFSSASIQHLVIKKGNPVMEDMLTLIHDCIDLFAEKTFGYELKIKSNICQLWIHLLSFSMDSKRSANAPSSHTTLDSQRIKTAITFIQNKYMEPLTLDEIAASIHVSKSECCRCFQRSLGLTAFEYLLKYRIFESTKKIMRGEKVAESISTLAVSVGFNNASYYNKIFKKYLGCTPTEYKNNFLNNMSKKAEGNS